MSLRSIEGRRVESPRHSEPDEEGAEDRQFAQDETPGSLTDRGMVFVLLGAPTWIGTDSASAASVASSTE